MCILTKVFWMQPDVMCWSSPSDSYHMLTLIWYYWGVEHKQLKRSARNDTRRLCIHRMFHKYTRQWFMWFLSCSLHGSDNSQFHHNSLLCTIVHQTFQDFNRFPLCKLERFHYYGTSFIECRDISSRLAIYFGVTVLKFLHYILISR